MKKIKVVFMALLAIVLPIVCSSCEGESSDEYFVVLDEVSSNVVSSETGESFAVLLYEIFEFDGGGKSVSLGECDLAPIEVFEEFCSDWQTLLQEQFYDSLAEDGWITYTFTLRKGSPTGDIQMTKYVHI